MNVKTWLRKFSAPPAEGQLVLLWRREGFATVERVDKVFEGYFLYGGAHLFRGTFDNIIAEARDSNFHPFSAARVIGAERLNAVMRGENVERYSPFGTDTYEFEWETT